MSDRRLKALIGKMGALWEFAKGDPGVAASVAVSFGRAAADHEEKAKKLREIEEMFAELHKEHVRKAAACRCGVIG